MKKKLYEKPSVEVVVMKQQPTLLTGSGQSTLEDYVMENKPEESRMFESELLNY